MKELQLAAILQEELAPHFRKVYKNVSLASNKFYPYWKEWHSDIVPSAQPQIDLLLVDSALWLLAVELKLFRKTNRGQTNLPFYAGIDEALALLRFGFMIVSLWHFFDEEVELEDVRTLYRSCDSLVMNLNLPINYQAFRMVKTNSEVEYRRLYDGGRLETKELPNAYGKSNPYQSNIDSQRIQDMLRAVLRIPHHR